MKMARTCTWRALSELSHIAPVPTRLLLSTCMKSLKEEWDLVRKKTSEEESTVGKTIPSWATSVDIGTTPVVEQVHFSKTTRMNTQATSGIAFQLHGDLLIHLPVRWTSQSDNIQLFWPLILKESPNCLTHKTG